MSKLSHPPSPSPPLERSAPWAGAPIRASVANPSSALHVAVVAFDGISPFHLAIPSVVFGEALGPASCFHVEVCAAEPPPWRTTAGYRLDGLAPLSRLRTADLIVVPSWRDVNQRPPDPLLRALRAAHQRGAYLVGLCLGAFVLAEAGLLDGQAATTHWAHAQQMASRFPAIQLRPDVLYVEGEGVMTSAGTAAGLDACLQVVRLRLGALQANEAARRLVIAPHRDGGQAQFIQQPLPDTAGGHRLGQLIDAVRASLHLPHDLDSLAAHARMSRRSFTRQFKAQTGQTVLKWLLTERLHLAQQLLEDTSQPIERVAELAGFGSAESLRLHFRRAFQVSPMAWRRRFGPVGFAGAGAMSGGDEAV